MFLEKYNMTLDIILEKELQKFDIRDDILNKTLKYLTHPEKEEIFFNFLKKNQKIKNILKEKQDKNSTFTLIFSSKDDALDFANHPTHKLLPFVRNFLKECGKNPMEYELAFNSIITYDESYKNKKPNVVYVQVI